MEERGDSASVGNALERCTVCILGFPQVSLAFENVNSGSMGNTTC